MKSLNHSLAHFVVGGTFTGIKSLTSCPFFAASTQSIIAPIYPSKAVAGLENPNAEMYTGVISPKITQNPFIYIFDYRYNVK
jgi:hypothetical protein